MPAGVCLAAPQPSSRHTTATSFMSQPSSHTVPQRPACSTSTRPSQRWAPFTKRVLGGGSENRRDQRAFRNVFVVVPRVRREGLQVVMCVVWAKGLVKEGVIEFGLYPTAWSSRSNIQPHQRPPLKSTGEEPLLSDNKGMWGHTDLWFDSHGLEKILGKEKDRARSFQEMENRGSLSVNWVTRFPFENCTTPCGSLHQSQVQFHCRGRGVNTWLRLVHLWSPPVCLLLVGWLVLRWNHFLKNSSLGPLAERREASLALWSVVSPVCLRIKRVEKFRGRRAAKTARLHPVAH